MYQLRGRVGRAHERAYAYLFFPRDRSLTEEAYERLKTISEHTGLGSGFRIALRDLEIRGAGNLLGEEQHGHIAEVGFELYTKLVSMAVDEAKGTPWQEEPEVRIDLPLEAYIPQSYIADENVRLSAYRRIAGARTPEELEEVRAELSDRFGTPLPGAVEALFELAELRRRMVAAGVTEAATVAGNLRIRPLEVDETRLPELKRSLPGADWRPATAALVVPERLMPATGVVSWVSGLIERLTSER
jgi:transcription-repair coupling factor (superfamily II helicase)